MAHRLCMALTRSPASSISFWSTSSAGALQIGGSYGNTNLGASNDMGEWEAWIKAGIGDDKTEIVVIADFWEVYRAASSVATGTCRLTSFYIPWGGFENRSPWT